MKKIEHRPIAKEGITAAGNILRRSISYSKTDHQDEQSQEIILNFESALTAYLKFMGYTPMNEAFRGYGRNEK